MVLMRELRGACIAGILYCALASATATAQGRSPTPDKNNAVSATDHKQFAFDVTAIHPMKPGFSPYDQAPAPVGNMTPTPLGFSSTMVPGMMVQLAYGANAPIDNMPKWFATWYFVNARVAETDLAAWQKQSGQHELLRLAMQAMLKDRFKLAIHEKPFEIAEYTLVVGKKGVKFRPTPIGAVPPQGLALPSGGVRTLDSSGRQVMKVHFFAATMADLVDFLKGRSAGLQIQDATGLTGRYDFTLELAPDSQEEPEFPFRVEPLGLRLKSVMTPSFRIVIDHVEPPLPN